MIIETLSVGSFEENSSIVQCGGEAFVIDPGSEGERIAARIKSLGANLSGILLTHAHFDHIGAIPCLQNLWPGAKVYLNERDIPVIEHPFNQFPPEYPPVKMPRNIVVNAAGGIFKIIETPGHTPGGVCYLLEEEGILFSGDTLFCGSVGRTDLPGGDFATLKNSLASLMRLDDGIKVIPGHGDATTIGRERRTNPYLQ